MKSFFKVLVVMLLCLPFLTWSGVRIYKSIDFNINCSGHIKRAADANTVEIAKKEINIVIKYLDDNKLNSGYVSIFLKQPKNDIGFWYQNLKASTEELNKVNENASQLEKSNILMKLRETLIDHGESTTITKPSGISIYPNNFLYFFWCILGIILLIVAIILSVYWYEEY